MALTLAERFNLIDAKQEPHEPKGADPVAAGKAADASLEADLLKAANRLLTMRAEARADAHNIAARAYERTGGAAAAIPPHVADTARIIEDLLLEIQGMPSSAVEPALSQATDVGAIARAARVAAAMQGETRAAPKDEGAATL